MENEVFGRYISSLRTEGKLFVIFSKDLFGNEMMIMYQVDTESLVSGQ